MSPTRLAAVALLAASALVAQGCGPSRTDPPGSASERTFDRAAGTNTSGAYPAQSDGTAANPRGTAAERAWDRAACTNVSGAYPQQRDGTPCNPPATGLERAIDPSAGQRR